MIKVMECNMDNLRQYAGIKSQIRELEARLEELKPYLMDMIDENHGVAIVTDFGTLAMKERRTYEYPESILVKVTELKHLKAVYESSKEAVLKNVVSFPVFFEPGVKDE